MSDTVTPATPPAPVPALPVPVPAPQAPVPTPPPAVPAPGVEQEPEVRMTAAKLKERLAEERAKGERDKEQALAAMLGGDIEAAKRLIAEAKAKDDAQKSEVQKLTEQNAAKDAQLQQLAAYKQAVEGRAAIEYASLNDTQKDAVDALAGSDPAARLKTIDTLRPTWAAVQKAGEAAAAKMAEEAKAAAPAPAPKIPSPASTTPAAPPPLPAQPGTPTNHLAVWESLKVSNPAAAATYRVQHDAAIRAAQRQTTG